MGNLNDPKYHFMLIGRMGKGEDGHVIGSGLQYEEAKSLALHYMNTWRFVEFRHYIPEQEKKMTDVVKNVIFPSEGKTFIATYGSLRRGMQNFRVNAGGGGEFVGLGKTVENYDLYRYGSGAYFPSVNLTASKSGCPVVVDVFEAPLAGLTGAYDALEGHYEKDSTANFYNRTQVEIEMEDGSFLKAWIYHIDEDQGDANRVESGDWCLHNRPNYYNELPE